MGQLLLLWTALAHRSVVVDDRRHKLLIANERPVADVLPSKSVSFVFVAPVDVFWCFSA